jgi:zinc transport system substrate-binding protein
VSKRIVVAVLLLLLPILAMAQVNIFVSVLPLKYFVNRIGGNRVNVLVMVSQGQSPETYAPTPKQMVMLSKTKIYYRIGVPFENAWLEKIAAINSNMQIVDLRSGIRLLKKGDPHIWTSPILVMQMAKTIRDSLAQIDALGKKAYEKNYLTFIKDLKKLDQYIRKRDCCKPNFCTARHSRAGGNPLIYKDFLDPRFHGDDVNSQLATVPFIVFHPAWGYFANTYGLKQIAIEKEGKEPGPKDLANIINTARKQHIRLVIVQPQFSQAQAQMIANTIHAKLVVLDPLSEDYLNNMYKVANVFARYPRN